MGDRLLNVRDLTVQFGGLIANDHLSIGLATGEVVGVIGPNGAGKSTLVNAVSGFVRPRSGSIDFCGRSITRSGPAARSRLGIGRTFQVPRLFHGLTVAKNLAIAARQASADRPGVDDVAEACGVAHTLELQTARLDAGDRRFVELARTLATRPRLVLLDEPATGLRESEVDRLAGLLTSLRSSYGISSLVISHDMRLVHAICDRVAMLNFGQLVLEGSPATVATDPRVVDAYLGPADVIGSP